MKKLNEVTHFFFLFLTLVSAYAFLRLLNDSLDLDLFGIYRSKLFNFLIPKLFFPAAILLFSFWIPGIIKHLEEQKEKSDFLKSQGLKIPVILWWVPIINFIGPFNTLSEIEKLSRSTKLNDKEKRKFRGGSRWIKVSFILFYTLALFGFVFFFIFEKNKDGFDLFLNCLFLYIIALGIGTSRMAAVIKKLE